MKATVLFRTCLLHGLTLALALGALTLAPLSGQSLATVDSLVRDGRMQEARTALLAWEEAGGAANRDEAQHRLWLRGVLTLDPAQARSSYLRLVVEYPGGRYTDRALLRLATTAELQGDVLEAEGYYRLLARDYPASPAHREAERWLEANGEILREARASREDTPDLIPPRSDREPQPPPPDTRIVSSRDFTVQLGAFSGRDNAGALAERVRNAGFEPRVVQVEGSPLFRVRVGRFPTRAAAAEVRDRILAAGFDAGVARDADRERTGGG